MLVRVEPQSEQPEWGLGELDAEVLRVRHPLPACARIEVTRPKVVIVGEDIRPVDVAFVKRAARQVGAKVLHLSPLIARDAVRGWVQAVLDDERAHAEAV
jgi:hypothetical protein